jgi:hypothetical protein
MKRLPVPEPNMKKTNHGTSTRNLEKQPPTYKTNKVCQHGYNIDDIKIWNQKLDKIKGNLKLWWKRQLSCKGKVMLIKALGISVDIDGNYIKPLKDISWGFLWNKKAPLINKESSCLQIAEGGLNMIDVENLIKIKMGRECNKQQPRNLEYITNILVEIGKDQVKK